MALTKIDEAMAEDALAAGLTIYLAAIVKQDLLGQSAPQGLSEELQALVNEYCPK